MGKRKINLDSYPEIVKKHKDGLSPAKIGKQYNVSEDLIRIILKKENNHVKRTTRRYFYNQNFFKTIDTEEKAYFLGLMYADGYNNNEGLVISLCEPDQYLLEKFAKCIGYEGDIKVLKKRKDYHKLKHVLSLYGKPISKDLDRLGCVNRKSLVLEFPKSGIIPNELMKHFIRGYFDGDGSVQISKENRIIASITGSVKFCDGFEKFIQDNLGITCGINKYSHSEVQDRRIHSRQALVFLDYIYTDASIKMERKFNKFIYFVNNYNPVNRPAHISLDKVLEIKRKWSNN